MVPVVAGGTMYYIEAILYQILVGESPEWILFEEDRRIEKQMRKQEQPLTPATVFAQPILPSSFKSVPSGELHQLLQQLDPEAAAYLHPNEKRKIIRCLQVMQKHETKYSSVLRKQRAVAGGSSLGGSLRFPKVVIFWTQTEQQVLDQRLDARVDEMMERGLLRKLEDFHERFNARRSEHGLKADYTQGIFQAIGFKEFHEYLLTPHDKRSKSLLEKCIREMKSRTRLYARKQVKWIMNRMMYASDRPVPPVFAVDTSKPEEWNALMERVKHILDHVIDGKPLASHAHPLPREPRPTVNDKRIRVCEVCERALQGSLQFEAHLRSKGHRALVCRRAKAGQAFDPQ